MKKMSKGMLMTALICGAVYLGGSPVYASELQEFSLDEYVVTAARIETKLVDTPANISVVDAQTIEERHYQDVSEILKDVPGANVLDGGSGAYEKAISLNGDTRVLILVDGRRMDFASGTSTGRASFDMNMLPDVTVIERIEILKGAGGALYGSDAVGGVVNIITKKANTDYGKVSVGFGSNDARDISAMYAFKQGKTGVTVSASKNKQGYFKYKDVITDKTTRWDGSSSYENDKVSVKIDQEISEDTNLVVGYDYSKYEGFTPGYIGNYVSHNDVETNNIYSKYGWFVNNDEGFIQIYHNEYDYKSVRANDGHLYGDKKEKTNGVDIQQTISISDSNKLVVGSSWYKTEVNNKGHYNEDVDNIAFFINDTWKFAPSWSLNIGVRYDDHSKAGDETTLSTGLNKKLSDNSHAYISWGQVFKAPTTGDLFEYSYDSDYDSYNVGNPNLKPETGDTWTIGYATEINNRTNFNVSYFESDLEDAIAWKYYYGSQSVWQCENIDQQKRKGIELSIKHKLNERMDLSASYSYIKVDEKTQYSNGKYVRDFGYIPNIYRLGLHYHDHKWAADLMLRAGSGAASNKYIESDYITLDCAVTYNATKDVSIFAKGYNLLNEAYAERGGIYSGSYDYPAQSRRFIVGAEYKF